MNLWNQLQTYAKRDIYPFHMPGHKRNTKDFSSPLPLHLDITEISGFDELHNATGILQEAMAQAAALWHTDHSFFLVNGSSGGILSAIRACTKEGDKILVARNCHRSVYHGIELCSLVPIFLSAPTLPQWGIAGSISPWDVEKNLKANPDCRVVFLTSPTYEGILSDIKCIAEIVHEHNGILLVDEAHGAHLGFSPSFPESAIHLGADIVIQSLHKTLPCPTQTGILHIKSRGVSVKNIQRQLSVFQTSSPSYLFLAAIDGCIHFIKENHAQLFPSYGKNLDWFYRQMEQLVHLRLLQGGDSAIFAHDRGKLFISTRNTNITGVALAALLREQYLLETEMAEKDSVLAMTSICDTQKGLKRLADALLSIDKTLSACENREESISLPLPKSYCSIKNALKASHIHINLCQSAGHISCDYLWAYPPGIPLIIPGEEISGSLLAEWMQMEKAGITLSAAYAPQGQIQILQK